VALVSARDKHGQYRHVLGSTNRHEKNHENNLKKMIKIFVKSSTLKQDIEWRWNCGCGNNG
jgi:hypothetical protein